MVKLRGAIIIIYSINVPPYDPIRLEFKGKSDLNGKQVRVNVFVVCKCIIININEHHDYNIIYWHWWGKLKYIILI